MSESATSGAIGAAVTLTFTGNGTTTAVVTPAQSGVSGSFATSTVTLNGTTGVTDTYTPSTSGTATFSATNGGGLTNPSNLTYTVNPGPVQIAPNDSHLFYSPYNWLVSGSAAKTINSGAYFRVQIDNTATCVIDLTIGSAVPYSQCWARLDTGPWQQYVPTASGAQTWTLTFPTGTSEVKHLLEFVVKSTNGSNDRWNTQTTAIQFTGLTLDPGASLTTPAIRKYCALIWGDSISEGRFVYGNTLPNDTDQNDILPDWAFLMCNLLNAEVGIVAFDGTGIITAGSGNVPSLSSSYNLLWAGQARTFSPVPDLVIYNEGTNDGSADITTAFETIIKAIGYTGTANTFAGLNGTRQLVLEPFGGYEASNLQTVVASIGSPNVIYGSTAGLWNIADSVDSLHPYAYAHLALAPPVAALALPLLNPATSSGRLFTSHQTSRSRN